MLRKFTARKFLAGAAIVAACSGIVKASDTDDIKAALQKLNDSPSYSWKATTEGGFGAGETDGKFQKDVATSLTITRQNNTTEAIIEGTKAAVKTDAGWDAVPPMGAGGPPAGGARGNPARMMGRMLLNFKTPPAQALDNVDKLENVKKTDTGYTADLTEDGAKALMTFGGRGGGRRGAAAGGGAATQPAGGGGGGPQITNPKATETLTVKDGVVTKMVLHVTGTMSFNGNDNNIDRTTTTEFTDIGSTTVTIPPEAKAKLDAPPATQP